MSAPRGCASGPAREELTNTHETEEMSMTGGAYRSFLASERRVRRPSHARGRGVALGAGVTLGISILGATGVATAAPTGPAPPGLSAEAWEQDSDRSAEPEHQELSLLNYFFVRGSFTNQLGDPSGLRGVSLGPLGPGEGVGSSTSVGSSTTNAYVEQRWIPVLSYSPAFADGLATFRAQFEVDYTWGLAANTVQNNQGGGFNADQVNIQTKNVNVAFYPTRNPLEMSILIGTHSVYDSIFDPTITSLFDIIQTGYKLSYLGSDATGISLFANAGPYGRGKLSFIPIGAAQPDKASEGDARFSYVYLATADYMYEVAPGTRIGASLWHLEDQSKGEAYAYQGLVKSGPSSNALSAYTGTAPFNIDSPSGDVNYLGLNFHHNINFKTSPFGASGFVMYNRGKFTSEKEDTQKNKSVDIRGAAANLELMYNWGFTKDDRVTLEGMYTTGDDDPNDGTYKGAFTMNYYGLPGAVWFNHKALILFPFTSTVSNYTGAVTDISNRGAGLTAGIFTVSHDVIPNKLNVKLGGAYARSVERPIWAGNIQGGRTIGAEVNAEIRYSFRYLMTVGLHGAYMARGDFFTGNPQIAKDPWAAFTTFTWYAF
ncbi:MAG: hypothetical protein R3B07_13245 [Polyangiaceae bacterium]